VRRRSQPTRNEEIPQSVVKKDGPAGNLSQRQGLKTGHRKACEKRPIPYSESTLADEVTKQFFNSLNRRLHRRIRRADYGDAQELRGTCHVRIATVYRQFKTTTPS
jgi:transcriptional regulator NrdR family protein